MPGPVTLPHRPPEPVLPGRLRWSASIALAIGLPVLMATAARWLGPGPHATVRIELALQPIGSGGGGGNGDGGKSAGGESARRASKGPPAAAIALATAQALPKAPTERVTASVETGIPAPQSAASAPALAASGVTVPALSATTSAVPARQEQPAVLAAATVLPPTASPKPSVPSEPVRQDEPAPTRREDEPAPAQPERAVASAAASSPAATSNAPGTGTGRGTGKGGPGGTVGPESLDEGFALSGPLRLIYPPEALALGQAGQARIEVEIDPAGRVARVTVLEETGRGFGAAASQAYARARFTPPKVAGRPVRVLLRKTIEFEP